MKETEEKETVTVLKEETSTGLCVRFVDERGRTRFQVRELDWAFICARCSGCDERLHACRCGELWRGPDVVGLTRRELAQLRGVAADPQPQDLDGLAYSVLKLLEHVERFT